MEPAKINYKIYQGSTFTETLRWESQLKKYATISAITKAAPCVITTSAAHGVPLNWRIWVKGAGGMKDINSTDDDNYYIVTSKTSDTLTLQQVNSSGYAAYTAGGVVEYNTPIPLAGYVAQMQIRETLESNTVIAELTSANGGILIDVANNTIAINISSAITTNFTFDTAVYSCELTDSSSRVVPFLRGNVTLIKEVTR
ncbi:MAG: hypothetical protein EBY29_12860 [Planctomycetes bacterium]|nr:hypothetical protein [Planctomycetota bacterium]